MHTVTVRASRDDISRLVGDLQDILAGNSPDRHAVAKGFMLTLGVAALSDIKDAFIVKAKGGTDDAGIKWPPLSPKTIANRRVGPRDIRNDPDIRLREQIRKRETQRAYRRFSQTLSEPEARRRAAIVGGIQATKQTGKTKVETLGHRNVEILRDTGVLLNSLSPGQFTGSEYNKPTAEGGKNQVFELGDGTLIVGTNVLYAATHQYGDPTRNIPARPFLPHKIPAAWWDGWLRVANRALAVSAKRFFQLEASRGGLR